MYAFANQPVQFLHVRLVRKHLQVLADNIFVIPHGRPRLRKTRFEFMHLTGGLVYQRQHHFKRKPVFLQQPGCKGIHMIGKITSEHRCQVQTFTLFGIGLIHILGEYGSNIFQCPGIFRRIAFHETGICRKSTVRCLLNVCIG